jgi:hypothetical protein
MPYPSNIDAFSTKVDGVTDVLAADINSLQVTVSGLQTKVGITSSGDVSSLDYKARYVSQNGDARGFQTNAGGWAFYSNNAGQLWAANYGWLHEAFASSTSTAGQGPARIVGNCGDIASEAGYELYNAGSGMLRIRYYALNCSNCNCASNCADCNCACGW